MASHRAVKDVKALKTHVEQLLWNLGMPDEARLKALAEIVTSYVVLMCIFTRQTKHPLVVDNVTLDYRREEAPSVAEAGEKGTDSWCSVRLVEQLPEGSPLGSQECLFHGPVRKTDGNAFKAFISSIKSKEREMRRWDTKRRQQATNAGSVVAKESNIPAPQEGSPVTRQSSIKVSTKASKKEPMRTNPTTRTSRRTGSTVPETDEENPQVEVIPKKIKEKTKAGAKKHATEEEVVGEKAFAEEPGAEEEDDEDQGADVMDMGREGAEAKGQEDQQIEKEDEEENDVYQDQGN